MPGRAAQKIGTMVPHYHYCIFAHMSHGAEHVAVGGVGEAAVGDAGDAPALVAEEHRERTASALSRDSPPVDPSYPVY